MRTKIINCTCEHRYQDKQYGSGKRVHNQTKQSSPPKDRGWRCTVCGDVKVSKS